MNKQPIFQGAYWRRFSNAAATGFVTENNNYQLANQVCTLRLESNDLAMGTVTCRLLKEPLTDSRVRREAIVNPAINSADMYSTVATPTFKKGSLVRIIAHPGANYVWDRFEDGAGNVIPSNTAQIDITINQSMTVRAFFRTRNVQQQSTLTVSYNHAQGTVTASPALVNDKVTVNVGASVVLTATPKQGYVFKQWRNVLNGGGTDHTVTTEPVHTERMVTGSKTIFADFAPAPSTPGDPDNPGGDEPKKTLTVKWDAKKGRVTCSSGVNKTTDGFTVSATSGDTVTLKAAPLTGYRFVKWTGGPVNGRTDDQVTLAVSADYAVYAEFAADNGGGGETPPGGGGGGGNNSTDPTVTNGGDTTGKVMAFVKKWWWALLIGAYLVYDATKGGRK